MHKPSLRIVLPDKRGGNNEMRKERASKEKMKVCPECGIVYEICGVLGANGGYVAEYKNIPRIGKPIEICPKCSDLK